MEVYGAPGDSAKQLFEDTCRIYAAYVLESECKSEEEVFRAAWAHDISTTLQYENATMIHNIINNRRYRAARPVTQGKSEPAVCASCAKEMCSVGSAPTTVELDVKEEVGEGAKAAAIPAETPNTTNAHETKLVEDPQTN